MTATEDSYRQGWDAAIRSGPEIVATSLHDMGAKGDCIEKNAPASLEQHLDVISLLVLVCATLISTLFLRGLSGALIGICLVLAAANVLGHAMRLANGLKRPVVAVSDPIQLPVSSSSLPSCAEEAGIKMNASVSPAKVLAGFSLMPLGMAALGCMSFVMGSGILDTILTGLFVAGVVSVVVGGFLVRLASDVGCEAVPGGNPTQRPTQNPALSVHAGPNADQLALLQSSPHAEFKALGRAIAEAWPAASDVGRRRLAAVYLDPASRMAELHGSQSTALPADEAATIAEATRRVEAMVVTTRAGTTSIIAKVMRTRMNEV